MTLLYVRQERVYYDATDAMGIVYHANYLAFMERARSDWMRLFMAEHRAASSMAEDGRSEQIPIDDAALHHEEWPIFVVTEANSRFRSPARLDDQLLVTVEVKSIRPASMIFIQRVLAVAHDQTAGSENFSWAGMGKPPALAGELHCQAEIKIACVDPVSLSPRRPPPTMKLAFDKLQTKS